MELYGRRKIFTRIDGFDGLSDADKLTELGEAVDVHMQNVPEMEYLYWYRRGKQPILNRTKRVKSHILNKIVINNADQVVVFKDGYFMPEEARYVARTEEAIESVKILNEFLRASGKARADRKSIDNFHTMGLAAMYVDAQSGKIFALDPRSAFVVYSLAPGNRPVYAVNLVIAGEEAFLDVYTERYIYRVAGTVASESGVDIGITEIRRVDDNALGEIPIIEYQYNETRMCAFENALSIMDEINTIESNRADGIEQFIQSIAVAVNCDIPEEATLDDIMKAGMLVLPSKEGQHADFKIISEQLDQSQTQVTLDYLYQQLGDKCGMPMATHNSGGTSDNVGSVYLRNGWEHAETQARGTQDLFMESNERFDRAFLALLKKRYRFVIDPEDFELHIPREQRDNMLAKTQVAMNMRSLGLAPQIWLKRSGLSNDPVNDIEMSRETIYADNAEGAAGIRPVEPISGDPNNGDNPQ